MMNRCVRLTLLLALVAAPPRAVESQPMLMSLVREANAADSAGRHREAADLWRRVHAITGGDPSPLYLVAQSEARAGDPQAALAALRSAVRDGLVIPESALEREAAFAAVRAHPDWSALVAEKRTLDRSRNDALRHELLKLAEQDQGNRADIMAFVQRVGAGSAQADSAERVLAAADAPLQARLRRIVADHGWPGRHLVGDDGAHAAWLILQHADSAWQREMLGVLRAATRRNDARPGDFAFLEDRVRSNAGLPQRYGNALKNSTVAGAAPMLAPLEMPECVDARRAAMLLSPLADYLAVFGVSQAPAGAGPCRGEVSREWLLRDDPPAATLPSTR